ncbi:MAG: putative quinol monooxygenase [Bacteroidota bacterium]|jgi:quinol monooxygenase YgiN
MITRIVKLEVDPDRSVVFTELFEDVCSSIRSFPGCRGLELLQDVSSPGVFFTISRWEDLQNLDDYRNSLLFKSTWSAVRPLFVAKPLAWSLAVEKDLNSDKSNTNTVS